MIRHALFLIFLLVSTSALAEELFIFPDSFKLTENDGAPVIAVREIPSGLSASVAFEASDDALLSILRNRYGEDLNDQELVHIKLLPIHIDFMSEFFSEANPSLQQITYTYDINTVRVRLQFNRDYSAGQIREAVLFPVSLATIDAQVLCLGDYVLDSCGKVIRRIPVINQFALGSGDLLLKKTHYTYLRTYASNLVLTSAPFLSEDFANEVLHRYWARGNCSLADRTWHQDACWIAKAYSASASIRDAVLFLARQLYPEDAIFDNADYFVFSGDKLKVRYLNRALDFEAIRQHVNERIELRFEDNNPQHSIPFVNYFHAVTQFGFQITENSLFWEGRKVTLKSGKHLRAKTDAQLSTIFSSRRLSVPIEYNVQIAFQFDPIADTVELLEYRAVDLEFAKTSGYGYELLAPYKSSIQDAINAILNAPENRAVVIDRIRETLNLLQGLGIGFEPLVD
jgi:hypothetical protein